MINWFALECQECHYNHHWKLKLVLKLVTRHGWLAPKWQQTVILLDLNLKILRMLVKILSQSFVNCWWYMHDITVYIYICLQLIHTGVASSTRAGDGYIRMDLLRYKYKQLWTYIIFDLPLYLCDIVCNHLTKFSPAHIFKIIWNFDFKTQL